MKPNNALSKLDPLPPEVQQQVIAFLQTRYRPDITGLD
jgi:hypothetical protein